VWMKVGVATLPAGVHSIEIRAGGPAMIDTLLITQDEFQPNGTTPPPVNP
jgi:hypothetical protein